MAIITLLTDFGTADGYVGEMKGVLLTENPDATLVDITHDLPPHDVEMGRLTVARYWRRFPSGTVHVAVVDPGVGSRRAALAVAADGRFLVGPDNGVLSPALLTPGCRAVALAVPTHASATFHGRDVFAPAAAKLASGVDVEALGSPARDPMIRRIAIDRFGNAITNLIGEYGAQVVVNARDVTLRRTYADLEPGNAGAVIGSNGLIEIVVRDGRAADVLTLERGTPVVLRSR